MNKFIIAVILFVILVVPALAQDTAEPEATAEATSESTSEATSMLDTENPLYCEGAQEWYDSSKGYIDLIVEALEHLNNPDPDIIQVMHTVNEMEDAITALTEIEYPDCVEIARIYYLRAFDGFLSVAALSATPETKVRATGHLFSGSVNFGKALGHLEAMGIDTSRN